MFQVSLLDSLETSRVLETLASNLLNQMNATVVTLHNQSVADTNKLTVTELAVLSPNALSASQIKTCQDSLVESVDVLIVFHHACEFC